MLEPPPNPGRFTVIDPSALDELLPDWRKAAPLKTKVVREQFYWLSKSSSFAIPMQLLPNVMHNDGCYIGSLGGLCQWLAEKAESLGVEIYPGFSAVDLIYDNNGSVKGVLTGDMGVTLNGSQKPEFTPGIEIHATYTLVAEGTRGSLTRIAEERFNLRSNNRFQKYGLGIKEIWEITPEKHQAGLVEHSLGFPLKNDTGGGSFIYHYDKNLVSIGFVVHLDYENPYLSPYEEFQKFKSHPKTRSLLEGGKRIAYGARALSEGGIQSLPDLVFPGGALLGCAAGMVNVPRIKGSHNAMRSGILAAESAFENLRSERKTSTLDNYHEKFKSSAVWKELHAVRNAKTYIERFGTLMGSLFSGVELWAAQFGLKAPWTLSHTKPDHECLKMVGNVKPIAYPKHDGIVSFDRLNSLMLSNIAHEHDQPCHLKLKEESVPVSINLAKYAGPEQRYCPAGVYEFLKSADSEGLQINSQNCLHCKTCDIKDPNQNIFWIPPEGGSGPIYNRM